MEPRPLSDSRVLRAIAHPVRNRILSELEAFGSMRAADVAETLGIPANQASFHLRQLAKYGLVEEDPEAARDKRDRVWKLVTPDGMSVQLDEVEQTPGGRAASAVFRRTKARWSHHVIDVAYGEDREKDTMRAVSEIAVRLTKAEAQEMDRELRAVADRWAERNRRRARERGGDDGGGQGEDQGADRGADDRRTYLHFQIVMPYPRDPIAEE